MKKFFKKKGKIVITVGDDGAIISCMLGNKLVERAFLPSPFSSELADICNKYKDYSLFLLLDTIDQNYVFSNLPALRSGSVMKMVKRKLTNEFDENDFNSYLCLGKDDKSVRKDLKYVFISVRNSSPLTDWLEVVKDLPNHFVGFYLYPVEAEDFISKVRKVYKEEKKSGKTDWEILISHNRAGGFRQVVFKDGKLIFTRISQASGLQSPDAIGVNISQEIANTLEYIRRIGYSDQPLSIYIVTSKEAASYIDVPAVDKNSLFVTHPEFLAQKFELQNVAQDTDKFGDVIFSANFAGAKKVLSFELPETKKANNLVLLKNLANYFLTSLVIIIPIIMMYFLVTGYLVSEEIDKEQTEISNVRAKLTKIKNFEQEFNLKPDFVIEVVKIKEKIDQQNEEFFSMLNDFKEVDQYSNKYFIVKLGKGKEEGSKILELTLELDLSTVQTYDDFFAVLDQFKGSITKKFEGKDVTFSNIPTRENIDISIEKIRLLKKLVVGIKII